MNMNDAARAGGKRKEQQNAHFSRISPFVQNLKWASDGWLGGLQNTMTISISVIFSEMTSHLLHVGVVVAHVFVLET